MTAAWYNRLSRISVKWKIFFLSAAVFGLSLTAGFAYFTYQSYWLNVRTALGGLMNFTDAKQQGVIRFLGQNKKQALELADLVQHADARLARRQFKTIVDTDVFHVAQHPFKDEITAGTRHIPTWQVYHSIDYVVDGVIQISSDAQREGRIWTKIVDADLGYTDPWMDGEIPVLTFAAAAGAGWLYVNADARMLTNIVNGEIGNLESGMGAYYLAGVGKTFDYYIVNRANVLITESRVHPNQLMKGHGSETPWRTTLQQAGVVCGKRGVYTTNGQCTTGCREAMGFYAGQDGKAMLGASMPFYDTSWTLVVEQEADELLWPMWEMFAGQLLVLLLIGAVAIYLYLRLQDRALIHPLLKLQQAIEDVEKTQDFSKLITVESDDEFGVLANSFNRMSSHLQNMYQHLEQRVSDRTNELEVLNNQIKASLADSREAQKQIETLAFFDPLTTLPNRRLLMDRLSQMLINAARYGGHGAILFIDLDNFKALNDTKGHAVGDMLLVEVANRLRRNVRGEDTVARLGGDEFVMLLGNLSCDIGEAQQVVERISGKVLQDLNERYQLGELLHHSSPSIGITLFGDEQSSVDDLLRRADSAMYQAKKSGRNAICFYDPKAQAEMEHRSEIEEALRTAIVSDQLQLFYQVQVNEFGNAIGAEALLRWVHPELGMVSPGLFIPIAEEAGLIVPIGNWVLHTACAQLARWKQNPLTRDLVLAINVSGHQFNTPDFVGEIKKLITDYAIDPAHFKIEITESILLKHVGTVTHAMDQLKDFGVRFSMDDFGTGYSSLSYIKKLPLDQLKIDQSFVRDLEHDKNDRAIVRTIIAMAHSMDIEVIAEGVETDAQRGLLQAKGCLHYQGYLFGKPLPLKEFEALLEKLR